MSYQKIIIMSEEDKRMLKIMLKMTYKKMMDKNNTPRKQLLVGNIFNKIKIKYKQNM